MQNEIIQKTITSKPTTVDNTLDSYQYINSTDMHKVWEAYKSIHNLNTMSPKVENDILTLLKVNNLNPFKKEAFIIRFKDSYTVVIAYQTLLRRAYECGYDSKMLRFKEEKITSFKYNAQNQITEFEDIQCTALMQTTDNKTYSFSILLSEYYKPNLIWREKPVFMLRKCAIACLCRTLPNTQLHTLPYTREELI